MVLEVLRPLLKNIFSFGRCVYKIFYEKSVIFYEDRKSRVQ